MSGSGWLALVAWPLLGAAQDCEDWHATFESVEGRVEVLAPGSATWTPVAQSDVACRGYRVRVDPYSRAALRLPDDTLLRLDQSTSLTIAEPRSGIGSLLDIVRGIIHVISRDPRSLEFDTPYANAGLEGTEFSIAVDDRQASVTVVEGEVVLANALGRVSAVAGERATAAGASPPVVDATPDAFELAGWTPYFPPVLRGELPGPDRSPDAAQARDPEFYNGRAARRLGVGRADEAGADLDRALELDPGNATAHALEASIALARGDRAEARRLVDDAFALAPESATVLLARARLQQAEFDPAGAEQSLERAVAAEPDHAIAWASLAVARLMLDDVSGAVAAAETAIRLDPNAAAAHTTLGFAEMRRTRTDRAVEAFTRASRLDQASPLARLGLGLALIRRGDALQGRRQIELAVALDPTSSLTRSTMARSYMAEYRAELTDTQLELANGLDPADPTPHYYAALADRDGNRPVDALLSLQTANELNGNRPVYRSQLLLDEDLASRSSALGELHRKLGFEQLALAEGWESSIRDPGNFSAHRLLGDVYSSRALHQIARVNEVAQSQLLQPTNIAPIQPQLSEPNLFIADTVGPTDLAFNEFGPVLAENGTAFQGSAVGGNRGTGGADVAVAGLHDRVSYSVGYYRYATDGFRDNNDLESRVGNAFVQLRLNADTSVLGELRSSRIDAGYLRLLFDPDNVVPGLRQTEAVDSARFGVNHRYGPRGQLLASVIAEDRQLETHIGTVYSNVIDGGRVSAELRSIQRMSWGRIDSGIGRIESRGDERSAFLTDPSLHPLDTSGGIDTAFSSVYSYAHIDATDTLIVTLGASWDSLDALDIEKDNVNPKLGLLWQPARGTTVRVSAFETLQGPLISKHSIQPRLEPTHVSGFNQFFFGYEGEEAERYGIAVDQRFTQRLYAGIEASERRRKTPWWDGLTGTYDTVYTDERLLRAYAYWMPTSQVSLSALYQVEDVDNNGFLFVDGFTDAETRRLPLSARIFHPSGFRAGIKATFVDQSGNFEVATPAAGDVIEPGSDRFWVLDLSLGYRLPKRRGELSLNVFNALDESFSFQDTDPENPRIMPERVASFRFTLAY